MLTIVIPYYKRSFFEATLASLSNQTNTNFIVYIGDDASPDDPTAILEKFKGKFDFIYKRFDENLGSRSLVQQWKRCLDMVEECKWIMILGDDDVLGENVVEAFYKVVEDAAVINCNVIRFSTQKIDKEGTITSAVYSHPVIEKSTRFLCRMYMGETRSSLSEYVFNFSALQAKGMVDFPLAWFSDVVLVLEISDYKEVYSINNALMKIRITEESISGSKKYTKQKNSATVHFATYLLPRLHRFTTAERDFLLTKIEKYYFSNKKAIMLGFLIFSYYIIRCRFTKAFSFVLHILKFL